MTEVDMAAGRRSIKQGALLFVHQFAPLRCVLRTVYYWFRFPTGYPVSGHAYAEQPGGELRCEDCGAASL